MTPAVSAQFPELMEGLFRPKRYKVWYGGRGAGRSWGLARALLILGAQRPLRILCCRELQKSISESVHKLLSDQIDALKMGHAPGQSGFYSILQSEITGQNGTTIRFEGIKNNTTAIKSYEGIDICWVEEANKVSKASWGILIPTIRKAGSEIWITFNPELETDYTYVRFVKDPELRKMSRVSQLDGLTQLVWQESDMSTVVKMTYQDNPWFPADLRNEMEYSKKHDPDEYLTVWEGHTRQNLEGAVFAKELRKARAQHRVCLVPWEREVPVDTFWDLGKRDLTAIWFAQKVALQYRILGYFEDRGEDIHYYLQECQRRGYTYGTFHMPHDAAHQRIGQKRSIKQITQAMGYHVHIVPKTAKKSNAINAARIIFPNCYFDAEECADGLQRLSHYRYKITDGQFSDEPLHDDNSNGADAFMTIGQAMLGEASESGLAGRMEKFRRAMGLEHADPQGWMGQ